ncbi:MAG TPA: PDZ domain-containing protein [Planctomycetaceae bacterium]|nr:PDZ domain-containing protein [Planctomycetaceae bacterium]
MCWNKLVRTGLAAGAICLWVVSNGFAVQLDPPVPDTEVKPKVNTGANAETQIESEVKSRGDVKLEEQPELHDRGRDARPEASIEGEAKSQTELGAEFEEADEGLTISSVQENSIAAQAGLRQGDQIVSIDGREFTTQAQMNAYLQRQDRRNVPMIFMRNGQRFQTTIVAGPRIRAAGRVAVDRGRPAPPVGRFDRQAPPRAALGVTLAPGRQGVLVSAIYPDSPAHAAGLWPQDEIVCINGWAAGGVNQFMSTVAELPIDRPVGVSVLRDGQFFSTTLHPVAADQAFAGEPIRSRDQLMARGEIGEAPIPPRDTYQDESDPQRRTARSEFDGQRRTVLRPDFEAMSREELRQEVETLRRENESLRRQLNSTRTQGEQPQAPPEAGTREDYEPSPPPPAPESSTSQEPPPKRG